MTQPNQSNTQWTPERTAELSRMRLAGKSFSEIATALNTTRSMIAGKCKRLGLPAPALPQRQFTPRNRRRRAAVMAVVPLNVPFRDTRRGMCRYVYGDPGAFTYCGHITDGGSYCAGHAALVYRRAA